jgi:hypothetical protein
MCFYNDLKQFLFYFKRVSMHKPMQQSVKFRPEQKALRMNMNKLLAVVCLIVSAAVSIGLIYLTIKAVI